MKSLKLYAAASLSLGAAAAVRVQRRTPAEVEAITRAVVNKPQSESRQVRRARERSKRK